MIVTTRRSPQQAPEGILSRVTADVRNALQSVTTEGENFTINDTLWFWVNPRNTIKPTVVNSANFISKKFQTALESRGWTIEKDLNGQRIDGYLELEVSTGFRLREGQIFNFLSDYCDEYEPEDLDFIFSKFHQMYNKRDLFNIDEIDGNFHHYFTENNQSRIHKIGLEFETGNIASSFRALSKLGSSYREGLIDSGIFITSVDKNTTAGRIWPVSNRNGSFEELERRDYMRNIISPLWEFSFAPDAISDTAEYLGSNGQTYTPTPLNRTTVVDGTTYEIFTGEGREILKIA